MYLKYLNIKIFEEILFKKLVHYSNSGVSVSLELFS